MFALGHVGLTLACVRRVDPDLDRRGPILLSVLPDLVDKPIGLLLPALVHGNTRNIGHTAAASAAALVVLLLLRRWPLRRVLVLWSCYLGHFLLDRLWLYNNPRVLFWPFEGPFPAPLPGRLVTLDLILYNVVGELIGLWIVLDFARRHRLLEKEIGLQFLRSGLLVAARR
jgi:hypothetical protein